MNNIYDVIKSRHSVRNYIDKSIEEDVKERIVKIIDDCNMESGLNIKLFVDEPEAFSSFSFGYGKFENVNNYIALIGKKTNDLEEKCGYYGEKIVLMAQEMGLNTCWVAATYDKKKVPCNLKDDEKLVIVIAIGYGKNQGVAHKSKSFEDVTSLNSNNMPDWFKNGVEYALLAPTALNQQNFKFELIENNIVKLKAKIGVYNKVDMGIVKYHFELGANVNNFKWFNN